MDTPEQKYPDANFAFWRSHSRFRGWVLNLSRYSGELGLSSDAVQLWFYLWSRQGGKASSWVSVTNIAQHLGWSSRRGECYRLGQARKNLQAAGMLAVAGQKGRGSLGWDIRPGLRFLLDIPETTNDSALALLGDGDGQEESFGTPEESAEILAISASSVAASAPARSDPVPPSPRPTDIPTEDEMRAMTVDALISLRATMDARNRATNNFRYGVASGAVDMIIQERNLASTGMV